MSKFLDFGTGIFSPKDIEIIIGVPNRKVRNWLELLKVNIPEKYVYSDGEGTEIVTNFKTMIEIFVFNELRKHNFSLNKILEAYKNVSKSLNTLNPFAYEIFYISGKDILFEDNNNLIKANGSEQIVMEEIIKQYYKKIEFDNITKEALKYYPLGKEKCIEVDPAKQFGKPVIKGTRITTDSIIDYYRSGETIEFIAGIYELEIEQINDVLNFYYKAS